MNILTIRQFYGFISPWLLPVVEAGEDGGEFELPNTTNVQLRWRYTESEEHISKTKTGRKPFPLQNHHSLQGLLTSCRSESSVEAACSFFVQYLLHNIHSELLQIGFLH